MFPDSLRQQLTMTGIAGGGGGRDRRWFGRTVSPASKAFNESRPHRLHCPHHLMSLVLPAVSHFVAAVVHGVISGDDMV